MQWEATATAETEALACSWAACHIVPNGFRTHGKEPQLNGPFCIILWAGQWHASVPVPSAAAACGTEWTMQLQPWFLFWSPMLQLLSGMWCRMAHRAAPAPSHIWKCATVEETRLSGPRLWPVVNGGTTVMSGTEIGASVCSWPNKLGEQ